jgi:transcriptional regulator with GAF, ATPase, and Fis domain
LLGLDVGDLVNIEGAQNGTGILSGRGKDPLGLSTNGGALETEDRLWMQVPLGEQSNLLGMLVVSAHVDAVLSDEEADLLQRVANQISPAIQNASLTADLTRTLEEHRVVAIIGRAASSKTEIKSIFAIVAKELENILPFNRFVASVSVPDSEFLNISYGVGEDIDGKRENDVIAKPNSDENRELRAKRAIVRNGKESFGDSGYESSSLRNKFESWVQVALGDISDPMGYLSFRSELADAYTPLHVDFLEDVARQISPTLKNAQMFEMERGLRE